MTAFDQLRELFPIFRRLFYLVGLVLLLLIGRVVAHGTWDWIWTR